MTFAAYLYHGAGVIMMPFISPGVPAGTERLRCNVTAAHTRAEMGYTLEALAEVGRQLDIIPGHQATNFSSVQKAMWLAEHKLRSLRSGGLPFLVDELGDAAERIQRWRAAR